MAKKGLVWWLMLATGLLTGVAIGELFTSLMLVNTMILGYVPDIAHKVIGWAIIATSAVGAFTQATK